MKKISKFTKRFSGVLLFALGFILLSATLVVATTVSVKNGGTVVGGPWTLVNIVPDGADIVVNVTGGGCIYSTNPANGNTVNYGLEAQTGKTISMTAGGTCSWTASSDQPWISITSGASGTGNGTITYDVEAFATTTGTRTGSITVRNGDNQVVSTITIRQSDTQPTCTYTTNPANGNTANYSSAASSGNSISITAGATCSWTASTAASWIQITAGASGTSNGTVTYSVSDNSASTSRNGTIIIRDGASAAVSTINISQAGTTSTVYQPMPLDCDSRPNYAAVAANQVKYYKFTIPAGTYTIARSSFQPNPSIYIHEDMVIRKDIPVTLDDFNALKAQAATKRISKFGPDWWYDLNFTSPSVTSTGSSFSLKYPATSTTVTFSQPTTFYAIVVNSSSRSAQDYIWYCIK